MNKWKTKEYRQIKEWMAGRETRPRKRWRLRWVAFGNCAFVQRIREGTVKEATRIIQCSLVKCIADGEP